MPYFLAKTDPEDYSLDDLERDGSTAWNGVRNPQALRAIQAMRSGDTVFLYQSGPNPAVTGLAKVRGEPRPDPADQKSWVVDFEYAGRLQPPVTLAEIKASAKFDDWALVRQPRLSMMAVPEEFLAWMRHRYPKLEI